MRKIRTLLALCLIFLGVTSALAADGRSFTGFTIDLTKNPVGDLPEGVEQVFYPQNEFKYNGAQHGWMWFAAKFAVDGPVKITVGGCRYITAGYEGYVTDENGTKLGDLKNLTEGCYDPNQPNANIATFEYTGEAKTLVVYCGQYCPILKVEPIEAPAPATGFQNFTIDLTKNPIGDLPTGVSQVSYPQNELKYNGAQHGWMWFAAKFAVDGPVKVTVGGCRYITADYEGYVTDENGTKLGDLKNLTDGCYDPNQPDANIATFEYKGGATTLVVYCGQYCPILKVEKMEANANVAEKTIFKTNFKDWEAVASSTTETSVTKTTTDGQELTFSLMETQVNPTGTNDKFKAECITEGYLMAAKSATPYIKTSTLANVTSVKFVHAATGSNRGWGLKVKGDGDDDWVTVSDAVADQKGTEVTVDVNRTNVQLWFYNLKVDQNAYMTSLEIKGQVEVAERSFADFKIDFRTDPYTVVAPTTGLPNGVTVDAGSYHGDQHGAMNAKITVPVDGPVKFTIGGCQYTNKNATVSIDGGTPIEIDQKSAGCANGFGSYTNAATYTYNEEKAATLTFDLGQYCPYFFAEACDYIPSVVVSYFNTDGKLIGEETVDGNSELKFKYSATDVTVPEGQAFRGWFDGKSVSAKKVKEGIALTEDTKLYAKATPIEVAKLGAIFNYPLNNAAFYPEDHELFNTTGVFHDTQHGFEFKANQNLSVDVAGNAVLVLTTCKYPEKQEVPCQLTIKDAAGNTIGETMVLPIAGASDGATVSYSYNGPATTLTATFSSTAYIHNVSVYNVKDVPTKNENGYYEIASGDASGFILALQSAKDGDKIFLPNGTYDFGETVLTTISVNNLSIIGESMDKTIIRNAPDKSTESIDKTATLLNTSKNLYMQDLTIQNDLDYYACGGTGRAVAFQDKGANTILKNVKMLSHQDTYYSHNTNNTYFEDCEVHGCVDYLCGDGNVVYNRCKFVNESRTKDKQSGSDILCAPSTSDACEWGYVFLDCNVSSNCTDFTFARAWSNAPKASFIRTKLLDNTLAAERFCKSGINVVPGKFGEFATTNSVGNISTPESNKIQFVGKSDNKELETVLTADEAAQYTIANIFGEWAPEKVAAQETDKDNGTVFLVDGKITTVRPTEGKYRIANARGGFGPVIDLTDIYQVDGKDITAQYIKNADLSDGLKEWTATSFAEPKKQVNSNFATESYAGWAALEVTDYALTQKIKLPAGSYKLVSNSFFRQGETYNTDDTKSLAFLKAGDKKVALKTLGSETAVSYANSQTEGAGVTTSGMYANEVAFEITASSEEIEIGVVGAFDIEKSWCIVGGFKLIDMNQKSDIIDVTNKIANNSFENGFENWTVEGEWQEQTNGESVQVGARYAEKWQANGGLPAGKISQKIEGLTNGKYIVKASAIATADGTQVFANDQIAGAPTEAAIVSIEVEVTDGTLTIGFERTEANQANWVAVDNFQLFYVQNNPEETAIKTVTFATTENAPKKFFKDGKIVIVKNGKAYNVAGVELK